MSNSRQAKTFYILNRQKMCNINHKCENNVIIVGRRQQVNLITSWLDLSNVYGSSKEEQHDLRTSSGGMIKSNTYIVIYRVHQVSELCVTPSEQCVSYIMVRTSYTSIR